MKLRFILLAKMIMSLALKFAAVHTSNTLSFAEAGVDSKSTKEESSSAGIRRIKAV